MASLDLAGHLEVIDHLNQNLRDRADLESVATIESLAAELEACCSDREERLLANIRALAEDVSHWQERAAKPDDEASLARRRLELEERKAASEETVRILRQKAESLAAEKENLAARAQSLGTAARDVSSDVAAVEPRVRHELSLYANISQIVWHFEKTDRVAGTYSNKGTGEAHTFDFDPASQSQFDITNALWDLME